MKPNWDYAPDWAGYLAQDDNGDWHWYELRPNWSDTDKEWLTLGKYEIAHGKEGNGTMECRP